VDYWPDWVASLGVDGVDVARGMFFSHTMLALDSAIDGQGVALAPRCLIERELQRRHLVMLESRGYVTGTGIHLAWPRRGLRALSPAATLFRDWLIEQAGVDAVATAPPPTRARAAKRSPSPTSR
jgi:LysR family glycine cleavage system transcriptional activator